MGLLLLACLFGFSYADIPSLVTQEQRLKDEGINYQKYEVKTNDGYYITIYRLPGKGTPALFVHGLLVSSDLFTIFDNSIAYRLFKNGNDVWLANVRGNIHGRKHEKLDPDDEAFWKFSYHEMGTEDMPAIIDFILATTNQKQLVYIGYSMGSMLYFILGSEKTEYQNKVKSFIALAPIASCKKYTFMISNGTPMFDMGIAIYNKFKKENLWELFPRKDLNMKTKHQATCVDMPEDFIAYCNMGMDMAKTSLGDFIPAGTSLKIMEHFFQCYTTGELSKFDYGKEENMKLYKQAKPPPYQINKIKTPSYLFASVGDQVIGDEDIEYVAKQLPNIKLKMVIDNDEFTHADYVILTSEDAEKEFQDVSKKIVEIVNMK